jgi:CRP/FNR family transcriptional regulator
VEQGKILYAADAHDERLFLLKNGCVRVYRVRSLGAGVDTVGGGERYHPGGDDVHRPAPFGGVPGGDRVLGHRRPETGDLEHLILNNLEVSLRVLRLHSEWLHETETRLGELSRKEVTARFVGQVLRLTESEGVRTAEGYEVPTRYTHEQLVTMIGLKRVPMRRAFAKLNAKLKKEGAVNPRDRKIHVVDPKAPKRTAEA